MSGALQRRFNRLPHGPSVSHVVVGQCAWLNGCAPARVDGGLRGKLSTIKHHAGDRTIAAAELVQS